MNREKRERMKKERESTSDPYLTGADVRPPAAPEIEASVLGAMMIEKEAIPTAIGMLEKDSFYLKSHQIIYEAMNSLFEKKEPIDTVTLYEELKKQGHLEEAGGAVYLSKLSQNIPSAANIEYHAKIILEKQMLRRLIITAHEIAKNAYEGSADAFELVDNAHDLIYKITSDKSISLKNQNAWNERAKKNYKDLLKRGGKPLISTGYPELDEIFHGFRPGELSMLASLYGQGKTTTALNEVANVAAQGFGAALFSHEMIDEELRFKLWAKYAKIDSSYFRMQKSPLSEEEEKRISKAQEYIASLPLYIEPMTELYVEDIIRKVDLLKSKNDKLALVVIDNLQGFKTKKEYNTRDEVVKEIVQSCKNRIAMYTGVHVQLLGQLNLKISDIQKNPRKFKFNPLHLMDISSSKDPEDLRTNLMQTLDHLVYLYRPEELFPTEADAPDAFRIKGKLIDYFNKIYLAPIKVRTGANPFASITMGFDKYTSNLYSLKKTDIESGSLRVDEG